MVLNLFILQAPLGKCQLLFFHSFFYCRKKNTAILLLWNNTPQQTNRQTNKTKQKHTTTQKDNTGSKVTVVVKPQCHNSQGKSTPPPYAKFWSGLYTLCWSPFPNKKVPVLRGRSADMQRGVNIIIIFYYWLILRLHYLCTSNDKMRNHLVTQI